MTSSTRTPDAIERDIADERAQMSGTINDLQKKFSVDAIVNDIGHMLRDQGGDLGRAISQTVGRNPAAVALVGVGLAWLFIGQDRKSTGETPRRQLGSGNNQGFRHRDSRGSSWNGPTNGANRDDDRSWYGSNGMSGRNQGAARAASNAVSDAAGSLGDATRRLTERLSHGTEELTEEARERVVAARRAAHDARLSAEDAMGKAGRTAINFFEDQPLVVGALAAALGAAIAGALPHSRIEDDTMGASSDRLFDEAEKVFYEERDKAMAILRSAASDVKDEVADAGSDLAEMLPQGKTVGNAIADRTTQAASRVVDSAKDEAKARNLGRRET